MEYKPYKTTVNVYKIERNAAGTIKKKYFYGLVTAVTTRGLIINPLKEEYGESLDILAGSWIPYPEFCDKYDIQIVKNAV